MTTTGTKKRKWRCRPVGKYLTTRTVTFLELLSRFFDRRAKQLQSWYWRGRWETYTTMYTLPDGQEGYDSWNKQLVEDMRAAMAKMKFNPPIELPPPAPGPMIFPNCYPAWEFRNEWYLKDPDMTIGIGKLVNPPAPQEPVDPQP